MDKVDKEYQEFLVNFEKWGAMKRWSDLNFCRRLRNLRAHRSFKLPLPLLEKRMEAEWHQREGRTDDAKKLNDMISSQEEETKKALCKAEWTTRIKPGSLEKTSEGITCEIEVGSSSSWTPRYKFSARISSSGIVNVRVDPFEVEKHRFRLTDLAHRPGEYESPFLMKEAFSAAPGDLKVEDHDEKIQVSFSSKYKEEFLLKMRKEPFQVQLKEKSRGRCQLIFNGADLLSIETAKAEGFNTKEFFFEDKAELTNEKEFHGLKEAIETGPQAISADFTIEGISNEVGKRVYIFGLPERCEGTTTLHPTIDWEPYRLWTADHYSADYPKSSMYGVWPMIQVKQEGEAWVDSILFANSSDTFVDVFNRPDASKERVLHWMIESGSLEFFFLSSASPAVLYNKIQLLTGRNQLPPLWSLGHHQCRWNYLSQGELEEVSNKMVEKNLPCDTVWLDIEYADGKRYFTWDYAKFPDPTAMLNLVVGNDQRLVTIIDPHIKNDPEYFYYREAQKRGLLVLNDSKSKPYHGRCWPEESLWLDFLNPKALEMNQELYHGSEVASFIPNGHHQHYIWMSPNVGIWIDMNEPACFEKTDKTMPKSNYHRVLFEQGREALVEHRDVHSLYGYFSSMSTYNALLKRSSERPFILSRSFFPGSQRYCAIWSGDSSSDWANFSKCVPILLQKAICGMSFVGGDIPGFYNDPLLPEDEETALQRRKGNGSEVEVKKPRWDEDLVVSWYALGVFIPFMRAHAHIDTIRREPWAFSEDAEAQIKATLDLRYSLLLYLYTSFYLSQAVDIEPRHPVIRPLWHDFPETEFVEQNETAFLFGSAIAVQINPESNEIPPSIPLGKSSFLERAGVPQKRSGGKLAIQDRIIKGSIVPFLELSQFEGGLKSSKRITESLGSLKITLFACPSNQGTASGDLYLDDTLTFRHVEQQEFLFLHFHLSSNNEWSVDILSNTLPQMKYNQDKSLAEQEFISSLEIIE